MRTIKVIKQQIKCKILGVTSLCVTVEILHSIIFKENISLCHLRYA